MSKDNVTIGDMTVGYSGKGMNSFKDSLKEMLVDEVEDALDELESTVKENLANCWTGESKDKYVKKLESQIEDVVDELKDEWKDLSARLTEVADFYKAQDEALAEWEG